MSIIKVTDLSKTYTTYKRGSSFKETVQSFFKREQVVVNAVDSISFDIKQGEICGMLGPNGAGKSTTIKMLCGALYPSSGAIDAMGFSPARDRKKYVGEIGAVFGQKSQLIWDIPPIDSFAMNRAIYGVPEKEYNEILGRMVELLDLSEIILRPTRALSLGERMKCEFVMAMLHKPKIIFLDEPTIGLDIIAKTHIREFIREINKSGTTFILTTHDLEDVKLLASRVIVINHGKKVFDDSLQSLQNHLGEKKIIDIVLKEPFGGKLPENMKIIRQKSPMELTLEADVSSTDISGFIEMLSRKTAFTDISVKELPMEEIITQIYNI